jgi:heme a synthase
MQSKLVGGWLLSTSFGVLGLITLGGYTRLKRAGLSMVEWKPFSLKYPKSKEDWDLEYAEYKKFPEFQQSQVDLDDFKEIYYIEWSHRMLARLMGLYLAVPMAVFWARGAIPQALKPRLLGISAMFGVQGALGWLMVSTGLQQKSYDGRVKVEPINLAIHLTCGVSLYSAIVYTALNYIKNTSEKNFSTIEKYNLAKIARKKYIGLFHISLVTVFTGALMAGSDAGKTLNNWPFYGDRYLFPEDALTKQPFYKNFIQNTNMIQFIHRSMGYLTYLSVLNLWFYMKSIKSVFPYMKNVHTILFLSTFQIVLGITALMRGTPFHESLTHQLNGMLYLSTILYGLNNFRKPNKAFIDKVLGK